MILNHFPFFVHGERLRLVQTDPRVVPAPHERGADSCHFRRAEPKLPITLFRHESYMNMNMECIHVAETNPTFVLDRKRVGMKQPVHPWSRGDRCD